MQKKKKDITKKLKTDSSFGANEEIYRFIIQNSLEGFGICDLQGKILEVNEALCQMLGYTREVLMQKNLGDVEASETQEEIEEHFSLIINNGIDRFDSRLKGKDGKIIDVIVSAYLSPDKQSIYGFFKDVTERKNNQSKLTQYTSELEQANKELEESRKAALNIMEDSVFFSEQLKQSQLRLVEAQRIARMGDFTWEVETGKVTWSEAMFDLLKYDKSEEVDISKVNAEIHHPEDLDRVKVWLDEQIKSGKDRIEPNEYRIICKDGEVIWIHTEGLIRRGKDKPTILFGTLYDITGRKQAERELKESEKRFELAMQASQDGLFDWNLETNEIYYSPGWKKMLGYEYDELPNDFSVWENHTDPEDVKKSWEMQQELINKQRDRFEMEFRMKHKEGHWVDILSRANAIFDDTGKAIRIVGTHIDISDLKKTEEELRQSEDRLLEAQKIAKIGNFVHHFEKNTLYWSNELYNIFDYDAHLPPPDYITFSKRIHPDDQEEFNKQVEHAQKDGTTPNITYRFYMPDGSMKYISSSTRLTFDSNGKPEYIIGTAQDITELQETENELPAILNLNKNIVNTSPIGIAIYDHDGDCIEVNAATCKIVGGSREQMMNQNYHSLDSWKESGLYDTVIYTLRENKKQYVELEISTTFGKTGIFNFHLVPFTISGKNHLLIMINDITERKKTENLLQYEKDKAQQYLNVACVMMVALDKDQNVSLINPAGCSILGYAENEIIGTNWFDNYIDTEDTKAVKKVFNQIISGNIEPVKYYENPVIRKDGEKRLIAWHNSIVKDTEGNIIGLFSSGEDISERKKSERKLRESEQKFRSVFESRLTGVLFWNAEGEILDANEAFLDIVGYSKDEILKGEVKWKDMTPPEYKEQDEQLLKELAEFGHVNPFEKEYYHKDGHRVPILIGAATFPGSANSGIAFIMDISDRIHAEEELAKHREHLEELVRERTTELEERNDELQRFHDATIDREFRIKELRDELDKLKKELE